MCHTSCLVLAAALAAGCSSPLSPVVGSHAIVGGTLAPHDDAVVLVVMQTATSERYCSGTVIAPHVVLTAAHCLDARVIGDGFTHYVFTGSDLNDEAQASDATRWIEAKALHADPDFDPEVMSGEHDLGLIITKSALAPAPLPMVRRPLGASDVDATLRVLGYGLTDPQDDGTDGTRYQIASTVRGLADGELVHNDDTVSQTCHGDSGGPSLLTDGDGVERIAGVLSWGEHTKTCRGPDHDARVDTHWAFLLPIVESADPGFLPAGPSPDLAAAADLGTPSPRSADGCMLGAGAPPSYGALLLAMIVMTSRRWWARRRCSTT